MPDADAAAALIRQKLDEIYGEEPSAREEAAEAEAVQHRSKHQQFMHELTASGKDLAAVQTEWHNYYQNLPPDEKHQVWQEFYASRQTLTGTGGSEAVPAEAEPNPRALSQHKQQAASISRKAKERAERGRSPKLRDARSKAEVRDAIRDKVTAGGKLEAKHHVQSLLFGLGMGFVVLVIFLFGFFNEVFIAPFIQPSRAAASTPLIVSNSSVAPSAKPEVIIPKINVQIPVVYGQTSIAEDVLQNALDSGVIHYPTTAVPGQNGNASFFGHSSNNIFNKGKYKFAFVMLHNLVPGDTFYLTHKSKVYVYKVISKKVVEPSEVGVLNPIPGKPATATLITCDPPGTSLRRLVVVGEQISPDPAGNSQAAPTVTTTANASSDSPDALPGNGETLLGRFVRSGFGKAVIVVVVLAAVVIILRRLNRPRSGAVI